MSLSRSPSALRPTQWIAAVFLSVMLQCAAAVEIHVVSSGGFAAAYRALAPGFELKTGHKLVTAWGPSMGATPEAIPNRLQRGEAIDVVIMVGDALDGLAKQGKVVGDSRTLLARSKIAMAIKAGAAKPDISSADALRRTLLAASSIAYSESASGVYLSTVLFPRLGIADQIKDKSRMIPGEPVGRVVARGEAEIGFQQVSELIHVPGVTFVGTIAAELQPGFSFAGALTNTAQQLEAARALIRFLASPEAVSMILKAELTPLSVR